MYTCNLQIKLGRNQRINSPSVGMQNKNEQIFFCGKRRSHGCLIYEEKPVVSI